MLCASYLTDIISSVFSGYVHLDAEMKNITKFLLETVRIKCEITGDPIPHYRWFKNDALIEPDKDRRFNIKTTPWGSRWVIFILISRQCHGAQGG